MFNMYMYNTRSLIQLPVSTGVQGNKILRNFIPSLMFRAKTKGQEPKFSLDNLTLSGIYYKNKKSSFFMPHLYSHIMYTSRPHNQEILIAQTKK